ncbi:MAG TPA: NAD(P)-binding protein, partial [Methylomirabilota bacterium]|nr:NAD(P)-binding protein [Methylomirabilota bacterium]
MKIGVLGGGPAGLYFALLMKRQNAAHEIIVVEQNPAGATYGWGVVFSDRALSFL